jgi:hypothetical protein
MYRLESFALELALLSHDISPSVLSNEPPSQYPRLFPGIETCQLTETHQLFVINIGSILLGEEIDKHSISAAFRQDDGTVQIPAQALLVDATAEVIGLAQHDLPDGRTKLLSRDQSLSCRFGKPSRFENAP